MKLIEINQSQKDFYNQFVAEASSGSFLQSWEWGEWQTRLGRQIFRYGILDDIGSQSGLIQLIRMPLPGKKHYLYAPYGPVFGVGGQNQELLRELQRKFAKAVFIRIEPKSVLLSANTYKLITKSSNIQPAKTLVIDLTKSEEQLLADMHHKTRYNIKLAKKHGVEIQCEFNISVGHGLFFDEALGLLVETAKRQKYQTYPMSYYAKLIDFFALHNPTKYSGQSAEVPLGETKEDNNEDILQTNFKPHIELHIYKAIFQNQLLAAAIMVDFGPTRTFLFGGSSEVHKNVMAPYLLHYTAMLDAQKQKMTQYDFWGIETAKGGTPGFVRFKLGFGGQEAQYGGAFDLVNKPLSYQIYKIGRAINGLMR